MIGAADGARHYAQDRLRSAGKRLVAGKERRGKNGCHACVLHSHLNGYGTSLWNREAEEPSDVVAKEIAKRVVTEHYGKHEQEQTNAVEHELWPHLRDYPSNDERQTRDAHARHHLPHVAIPTAAAGITIDHESYRHRDDGDEEYATKAAATT